MIEGGIEITGRWVSDLRASGEFEGSDVELSDAQRRKHISDLANDLRDCLDRRKKPNPILRDSDAVWEAIHEALGDRRFKEMVAYVLGEDEEVNEWLEMASYREEDDDECDAEDDEDAPNF